MSLTSRIPSIVLCLAGLLAPASASFAEAKIGPGVAAAVEASGTVRVMILLDVPPGTESAVPSAEAIDAAQAAVLAGVRPRDFAVRHRFSRIPALAGEIGSDGLETLARTPGVLRIDLDAGGRGSLLESAPLVRADELQARGFSGEGITVAVLDSGIDTDHTDLGDDLVGEVCFCSGGDDGCCPDGTPFQVGRGAAEDDNGHGSNIAGIITSDGNLTPTGIAPDAGLFVVKVLETQTS